MRRFDFLFVILRAIYDHAHSSQNGGSSNLEEACLLVFFHAAGLVPFFCFFVSRMEICSEDEKNGRYVITMVAASSLCFG